MFIPTICCVTGSFFHQDGRRVNQRLNHHFCIIKCSWTGDVTAAVFLIVIGALSFATASHIYLPLVAKVTMITGGTLLMIVDITYFIYRSCQARSEIEERRTEIRSRHLHALNDLEVQVTKIVDKSHDQLYVLESDLIPSIQGLLEEENGWIQQLKTDSSCPEDTMKSALSRKQRLEEMLRAALANLDEVKAMLDFGLEKQEEVERFRNNH